MESCAVLHSVKAGPVVGISQRCALRLFFPALRCGSFRIEVLRMDGGQSARLAWRRVLRADLKRETPSLSLRLRFAAAATETGYQASVKQISSVCQVLVKKTLGVAL